MNNNVHKNEVLASSTGKNDVLLNYISKEQLE